MAQSLVKRPTLDLGSGHDLLVRFVFVSSSPVSGSVLKAWSLLGILSLPFSSPSPLALSLSE